MDKTKIKVLSLYTVLIIYLIINSFIKFTSFNKLYIKIINPLFLFLIALLTYLFTNGFKNRNRNKYSKRQTIIIIVIGYCIVYYLSGLIFGFLKNGYSLNLKGIISNFFSFYTIIVFEEYIRYRMVSVSKKNWNLFFITILFILINIDFNYLLNINSSILVFRYVLDTVLPIVLLNITLTYLTYKVDFISNLLYRSSITIITLFSPIIPNHEWIITDFLYLVLLIIFIISIDYLNLLEDRRPKRKELKNERQFWILFVFAFIFILFMIGMFKYQPIAIMSNSMYDYFARGDAVIIEKLNTEEKKNIKVGDIIHYKHDNTYITHRVIYKIENNGVYTFYTKGDNNEVVDSWEVNEDDINGIIRLKIKYLGWPSVWLNELLT